MQLQSPTSKTAAALRLGYQQSCCRFPSTGISYNFSFHSQLLAHRPNTTSELSAAIQPNFTVTYLINSCGLSPQDAISASTRLKLQNPTRADSVLALFSNYGFSETQISKLVKCNPIVLVLDPEKILAPKIQFFVNVGLSREDLARVVTYNSGILSSSLEKRIVPTYNFLREMISQEQVVAVLKRNSWMFNDNLSKNMKPNIELLRERGVPETGISLLVAHYIAVLMHNHEDFAQLLNEVKEMGFDLKKSTFIKALCALCGKSCRSIYNRNREIFKSSWGWSDDDVASAFRKNPLCMTLSEKKLMQTMDFLVNTMGWSTTMITAYPTCFTYSLEKRIIPRCRVVKVLMSKELVDGNLSLAYVVLPEKQFLQRFVTRYLKEVPELMSVYEGELDWKDVIFLVPQV